MQAARGGENKRILTEVECVASRLRPAVVASVGKPQQDDRYPPVGVLSILLACWFASGEFRPEHLPFSHGLQRLLCPSHYICEVAEEASRRFVIQTPIRTPASRVAVQRLQFADRQ